jgi:hypothetical protein
MPSSQVPAQVVVGRVISGQFAVSTIPVTAPSTVTITAAAYGSSASRTLSVTAGPAPAADTVEITRAEIAAGLLRIGATTSNPNAFLTLHIGGTARVMTSLGGGKLSDQSGWIDARRR